MRFSDLKKIFKNAYAAYSTLANGTQIHQFTTAITADTTVTTAPAGSLAVTTHSTGRNTIFVSDGSKWQYIVATAVE